MNKFNDTSRLEEKIIDIILPLEIVYKEDKGESVPAQLRHGRLADDLYSNKKVINTRYGDIPIITRVKVYFRAFNDDNTVITVDIYNNEDNNLFKKFIIKSSNNNFSIVDMKTICDEIKNKLNNDDENKLISLIDYIRNYENLKFEEIAQ